MTYRVFVFTWEISFKLHFWFCVHISHACHATTEPKELQGCIPSAWCIPDTNTWAGSVWLLHGDQSHQPTLTTLLPLCPYMFIVAHTQVSMQTSLHAATDVVSFAKHTTFAVFQGTAATAFPTLSAAAAAGGKDDKMEQLLKERLGIALLHKVPFLSSRKKHHLAESGYATMWLDEQQLYHSQDFTPEELQQRQRYRRAHLCGPKNVAIAMLKVSYSQLLARS